MCVRVTQLGVGEQGQLEAVPEPPALQGLPQPVAEPPWTVRRRFGRHPCLCLRPLFEVRKYRFKDGSEAVWLCCLLWALPPTALWATPPPLGNSLVTVERASEPAQASGCAPSW